MRSIDAEHFLLDVTLLREQVESFDEYPFSLAAIRGLEQLEMHPAVTFLVGENGAGKSTLLEAIAVAFGMNPEGGSRHFRFQTRESHSELYSALRLNKGIRRPRDSYFLRAESYYNVATEIERLDSVPGLGAPIIDAYGGKSLHEQSHGESFFSLFTHRFRGKGMYFLDEPEAALSPSRLLSFLVVLHQLVGRGSQFLIASHSPIILAYPQAKIFLLEEDGIAEIEYRDTEHFNLTRDFLQQPEAMLERLLADAETHDE